MNSLTIIFILVVLVILVLLIRFRNFFFSENQSIEVDLPDENTQKKRVPCILCGAQLEKGENLKSEEYKGEKESLVYIRGCPYCTGTKDSRKRTCPVCHDEVPMDQYLVARMWIKPGGKRHVHVSGCTACSRLLTINRP